MFKKQKYSFQHEKLTTQLIQNIAINKKIYAAIALIL